MEQPGKILVVDDEEIICDTMRLYLQSEGFQVLTVQSGAACLNLLTIRELDVVILDILMPDMNGLDVLRQIREKDLPTEVIVATGAASHNVGIEAIRLGAFELLRKPILDFEDKLLRAVKLAIDRCRLKTKLKETVAELTAAKCTINELYQFGRRMLRATNEKELIVTFSEAMKTLYGDVPFMVLRAQEDHFIQCGDPEHTQYVLPDAPISPFGHKGVDLPLPPAIALFPLEIGGETIGALAIGAIKQQEMRELLPVLTLMPALASTLAFMHLEAA